MVTVSFPPEFRKQISKIKDTKLKDKIKKKIVKIVQNPEIGKPLKFSRKGTREVYVKPFRLSYAFHDDKIILLCLYHKDLQ